MPVLRAALDHLIRRHDDRHIRCLSGALGRGGLLGRGFAFCFAVWRAQSFPVMIKPALKLGFKFIKGHPPAVEKAERLRSGGRSVLRGFVGDCLG